MSRFPESTRPDAIRLRTKALSDRIKQLESAPTAESETIITGWTDAQPRWIALTVPYTLFTPSVGMMTVDVTITNLPPGTVWTGERIDVVTTFVSVGGIWRMTIKVPVGGTSVGGTPKGPDVTTPDPFAQLIADEFAASDPAGACDVTINLSSSDTADQLTQGVVTVHLLVSIPGAITDTLPHS